MTEKKETNIGLGSLYEANQELMKKEKEMSKSETLEAVKKTMTLFNNGQKYFMLLCNDRRDYTVFHRNNIKVFNSPDNDLADCILNRGSLLAIDETNEGNFEIWIKIDGTPYCYYLFPYDFGIIESL